MISPIYLFFVGMLIILAIWLIWSALRKTDQNTGQNSRLLSLFKSIWFLLFFLTFIYLLFNINGYPSSPYGELSGGNSSTYLNRIASFIGLFVPFGLIGTFFMLISLLDFHFSSLLYFIVSLLVPLSLIFFLNKKICKYDLSLGSKILVNLLILMLATLVVDMAPLISSEGGMVVPFHSWKNFLFGDF